jgi:uncharacterized cupredoxin-like copper-binding protein
MTSDLRTLLVGLMALFVVAIALAIAGLAGKLPGTGSSSTMALTTNSTSAPVLATAVPATAAPAPSAVVTPAAASFAAPTPGPAPTESEGEQMVAVSLAEWKITEPGGAAIRSLKAGEINFDVHNDGTTQHEFVLIKTDADPTALPVEDGKVNEETAGASPGEADDIEAGQAKSATMRLEPGKYVFICNVVGHYLSGMRGELIVQ